MDKNILNFGNLSVVTTNEKKIFTQHFIDVCRSVFMLQ